MPSKFLQTIIFTVIKIDHGYFKQSALLKD